MARVDLAEILAEEGARRVAAEVRCNSIIDQYNKLAARCDEANARANLAERRLTVAVKALERMSKADRDLRFLEAREVQETLAEIEAITSHDAPESH